MSGILIDLGELGGEQRLRTDAVARRPRPYRPVLAALGIALIAMLTGAAHRGPPAPPTIIAARLGDAMFVAGDRLYLISAGPEPAGAAGQNKIISRYALPAGNLLSRTTVVVSGAIFDVTSVRDIVLVSYQVDSVNAEATVALTAGTGRALWRRPTRLLGVLPDEGLVLLRENSPQFGPLHWYGIDLASGAVRWSVEQPVRGDTAEGDYDALGVPHRLITVTWGGEVEVRDMRDGALTARAAVPLGAAHPERDISVWPVADMVLIGNGASGTTAYDLTDLAERWHSPVDLSERYLRDDCGSVLCVFSPQRGVLMLDPATGRTLWQSDRWSFADRVGPYLLAGTGDGDGDGAFGDPRLVVLDAATGRLRGDFGTWQAVGPPLPDGTIVGLSTQSVEDAVWYARLDPATLGVQVIGAGRHVAGDCQTTPAVLVCRRVDASVGIWRLRTPGGPK